LLSPSQLARREMRIPSLVADWLGMTTFEAAGTESIAEFAVRLSHGVALRLGGCSIRHRSGKRSKQRGRDLGTATVGFTTVFGSNMRMDVLLLWTEYSYTRVTLNELSIIMTGIYTTATPCTPQSQLQHVFKNVWSILSQSIS
jgi:hypothetical protein